MRRELRQPATWAAGLLILTLISACGDMSPAITEATQSQETIRPGERVRFDVRYSAEDALRVRLVWKTNFGRAVGEAGSTTGGTAGSAYVHFEGPGCLREGLIPTITVTMGDSLAPEATHSFTLTPLEFPPCTWTSAGSVGNFGLGGMVVLPSGKVMMAGGSSPFVQLYEPSTQQWTIVARMLQPRLGLALVVLPSGKVLAAGGYTEMGTPLASAELYDPASDTWTATGSMTRSGRSASALVLPSGKVLLTSNFGSEVYDPATGTWTATRGQGGGEGPLVQLSSGAVLKLTDGQASVQLYAPNTDSWGSGQPMNKVRGRSAVTPLLGGKILVVGGDAEGSAELYDPVTGWSSTGRMIQPRHGHTATLLASGKVLVTGGTSDPENRKPLSTSELYDPLTGTWSPAGAMEQYRVGHHAALLPSGEVLVVGGATAELYRP
ncbi:MAG TPA: kelch repeat-containing protein [Myxococcaceae bacterium]|nr:kelch repeat-containing protein [Myxococcaceae bacterium]